MVWVSSTGEINFQTGSKCAQIPTSFGCFDVFFNVFLALYAFVSEIVHPSVNRNLPFDPFSSFSGGLSCGVCLVRSPKLGIAQSEPRSMMACSEKRGHR